MKAAQTGEWPLVGREAELQRIVHAFGSSGSVVVAGSAGVGKTRLAAEAVALAEASGWRREWIAVTPALRDVPLGGLLPLLPAPVSGAASPLALLQQTRAALLGRAGDHVLLVVDDAHHLDELSVALLTQLAASDSITVLATIRSDERAPERLRARGLDGAGAYELVAPLGREEARGLVEAGLGGPAGRRAVERLWRLARGNPLFTCELVRAAVARGDLVERHGRWQLVGELEPSRRLADVVEARFGRLPHGLRQALEILAHGGELSLEVAVGAAGRAPVAALERKGVVSARSAGRRRLLALAHPVYGEVVRAHTPIARRAGIAHALSDALAATGARRRDDLLRLGLWRLEAGAPPDARIAVPAAHHALARFDPLLAERLVRPVVEATGSAEADAVLAEALARQGRLEEAERLFTRALQGTTDAATRTWTAIRQANAWFFRQGRSDEADELLAGTAARLTETALVEAVEAARALHAGIRGDVGLMAELGDRLDARGTSMASAAVAIRLASTVGRLMLGRLEGLGEEIAVTRELAGTVALELPLADAQLAAVDHLRLLALGEVREASRRVAGQLSRAAAADAPEVFGLAATAAVFVHELDGELEAGIRAGREAREALARGDEFGLREVVSGGLALLLGLGGELEAAERLLDGLPAERLATDFRVRVWAARARVHVLARRGDVTGAARLARAEGLAVGRTGHLAWALPLLHDAVRIGRPAEVVVPISRWAEQYGPSLFSLMAVHARRLADRDGFGLTEQVDDYEAAGACVLAVETAAQAARVLAAEGAPRRARRLEARAATLLAACAGLALPPLPAPRLLSERETEVAMLALQGLSSRRIAEQLVLSVRTVDNHLASVYRKLGVRGRQALTAHPALDAAPKA